MVSSHFSHPLHPGTLLRRYQRFLADVRLADGREVTAHCANPGSMKSCLLEGGRVWLSPADKLGRKLKWTLEICEVDGACIYVNPSRANDIVVAAIKGGAVAELRGYDLLRREVRFGHRSRIDILLSGSRLCYVEVKNVTLSYGDGRAAFPDSVTARGTRHLLELIDQVHEGHRAVLFFCVARDDARSVEPADAIDPVYGRTLRLALELGVEVLAYRCSVSPRSVALCSPVELVLPALVPRNKERNGTRVVPEPSSWV